MKQKKVKPVWDQVTRWPILKEISDGEEWKFDFGEAVGLIAFGFWWPGIRPGHQWYATTYRFPVRLKFIHDRKAPDEMDKQWYGWNLPQWIQCARELEQEGVRVIVCGCGLTGTIQCDLSDAVDIPVFASTMLFIPLLYRTLRKGRKIGILTVSSDALTRWDNKLLKECGVDQTIPVVIGGMTESDHCDAWWSQLKADFDPQRVQGAVVNVALEMIEEDPEIGALVCECTDMTPYSSAIRRATSLPVFDAVDMVKFAHNLVQY